MAKLRQPQVEQPTINNTYSYTINDIAMLNGIETLDISDNEDNLETDNDLKTIPYNINGKPISILNPIGNGFTEKKFITEYKQAGGSITACVAGTVPKAGEQQVIFKPSYLPGTLGVGLSGYSNYYCVLMKVDDQTIRIRDGTPDKENFRDLNLSMLKTEYNYHPIDNKIGKLGLLLVGAGGTAITNSGGDEVRIPGYKSTVTLPRGGAGGGGSLWGVVDFRELKNKDMLLISYTYDAMYLFYISGTNPTYYEFANTRGLTNSPLHFCLQTARINNLGTVYYSTGWDSCCRPSGQGGAGHGSCFDCAKFNESPNDTLWHTTVDQGQTHERLIITAYDSYLIEYAGQQTYYQTKLSDKRTNYGCIAYIENGKYGGRGRSNGETEGGDGGSEYWVSPDQKIFTYVGNQDGGKGAGYNYNNGNITSVASADLNYSIEFFEFKSDFGKQKYSTIIDHSGNASSMDINNQSYFIPGGNSFGPAITKSNTEDVGWGCGEANSSYAAYNCGPGYWALYY